MKWTSIDVAPFVGCGEAFYVRLPENPHNYRIIWSKDLSENIKMLEDENEERNGGS